MDGPRDHRAAALRGVDRHRSAHEGVAPGSVQRDGDVEVVETHSAVLIFAGDRVYKAKKAVDLGFLDFSDVDQRRRACEDEVALNRRLAPDAYLGTAHVVDDDGTTFEHLVVMRRMPPERRLSACVRRGEDVGDALAEIAHRVAVLHDLTGPDARHDRLATRDAVRARWEAGFDQIRDTEAVDHDRDRDDRIEELVERYLAGREPLFDHRIRRGRIRDGHGDLLAEDIFLLDEGPQILDCLEFSEDLRWGDVLADVAFLAMDLERLGHPELGRRFLELHREHSADAWPDSLAHHYIAYRAHVRAKVGLLRAAQEGVPLDADTDRLFDLALRHLEAGRVRLVVVGGAPGTGKSTLATELGDALGAVVLRSDEVRRRADLPSGYDPEAVAAAYRRTLDDARRLLGRGESVVLDATFGDARWREAARDLAVETSSELAELRCCLPESLAAERIARRRAVGTDASEATVAVGQLLADRFEPWPEAIELDTSAQPDQVAASARAALG